MPDRPGRPRASSRDTLAEAACELFLERGYAATTVEDIARRAGVARSSFFAYFGSKADVVWSAFDDRLDDAAAAIAGGADIRASLVAIGDGCVPGALALAVSQASAMGIVDELDRDRGIRQHRLARTIAARLVAAGGDVVVADIRSAALAAAVFAALHRWALDPSARPLDVVIADAWTQATDNAEPGERAPGAAGAVRQLRLVVRADHWDAALAFYRDVVGMPVEESYQAEGGARVAILAAGRATLELSNRAQVAFIDRVETDGDAPSDRLRVALEVADAAATTERLAAAGAAVEASPRQTPWGSVNARLRGAAGLQLTLFQELDAG